MPAVIALPAIYRASSVHHAHDAWIVNQQVPGHGPKGPEAMPLQTLLHPCMYTAPSTMQGREGGCQLTLTVGRHELHHTINIPSIVSFVVL